jgi:hypothetical protein
MLPKMRLQHGQCLNERHGMGKLGFKPTDKGSVKPPNTESLALKAGHLTRTTPEYLFEASEN